MSKHGKTSEYEEEEVEEDEEDESDEDEAEEEEEDEEDDDEEKTYDAEFTCTNCGESFDVEEIPMGTTVKDFFKSHPSENICDKCGCKLVE